MNTTMFVAPNITTKECYMMIEQTIKALNEMKLYGMANGLQDQLSDPAAMSLSFGYIHKLL